MNMVTKKVSHSTRKAAKKTCKHYDICGLYVDADPEAGLCILHSKDPNKDKKAFAKKLEEHRKNRGDDFRYFVFPEEINFFRATFSERANFGDATFSERANFVVATFTKGADFFRATFSKGTSFMGATFSERANFGEVTFTKKADFGGATFSKWANFGDATFSERADLGRATFIKEADFGGATFTGEVGFRDATFRERAIFGDATFNERADFGRATFRERANFGGATFRERANFGDATFSKEAGFRKSTFTGEVGFRDATFRERANFYDATFTKEADFFDATFTKEADFLDATFTEGANFPLATFSKGATFWGTIFENGNVLFILSKFFGRTLFFGRKDKKNSEKTIPIFRDVKVDFRNADINPPNVVIFRDADLSHCKFQGTRVDKIEFTGVKWTKIPVKFGYSRIGICDEKVLLESIKSKKKNRNKDKDELNWEHIERVYRDLKKNHEENRDYERAGDFHYGEKEMRRKNPDTPRIHRYFLHLYCWLSGYGERYLRPLFWAAVLLIACTFGYLLFGVSRDGIPLKLSDLHHIALYSLQVMTFIRPTYLEHTTWLSMVLKVVQSIFGPVIIGLFALALRQRLRR